MKTFATLALFGVAAAIRLTETEEETTAQDFLGDLADGLVENDLLTREEADMYEADIDAEDILDAMVDMDTNGDGEVDADEGATAIIGAFGLEDTEETREEIKRELEERLGGYDTNGSGGLCPKEVLGEDSEGDDTDSDDEEKEGADFLGDLADGLVENDLLTREEADMYEADIDAEDILDAMVDMDTNGDGEVDADEGATAIIGAFGLEDTEETREEIKRELKERLGAYDQDGSGALDLEEVLGEKPEGDEEEKPEGDEEEKPEGEEGEKPAGEGKGPAGEGKGPAGEGKGPESE